MPSARTLVRDSNIISRNVAIGSSVLGNVTDVVVQDCAIGDDSGSSPWAIKIKTHAPSAKKEQHTDAGHKDSR